MTPGWPSTLSGERLSKADVVESLPKIPSLPISAEDAILIMNSLNGPIAPPVPHYHIGGKGLVKLKFNYKVAIYCITYSFDLFLANSIQLFIFQQKENFLFRKA